jgi:hypothetical protein
MSDSQFDTELRQEMIRAARSLPVPSGAVDRAIEAARSHAAASPPIRRRIRPLIPAIAAAIAILVIVSVVTVAAHRTRRVAPGTTASTGLSTAPPPSTPTHSGSSGPSPNSTSPPSSRGSASPPSTPSAAPTRRVTLGDATLSIPADWAARAWSAVSSGNWPTWCLGPPPSAANAPCLVMFRETPRSSGLGLDPNVEGGRASNPQYCGTGGPVRQPGLLEYDDRSFGGRPADYRRWQYNCANGTVYRIEQYVVATGPGYILSSEHADTLVHTVMANIASTASIPAQSASLRYADTGIVRSVSHQADGFHIALDRVVISGRGAPINNNPATYPYTIPDPIAASSKLIPAVGELVFVGTDGFQVKLAYRFG